MRALTAIAVLLTGCIGEVVAPPRSPSEPGPVTPTTPTNPTGPTLPTVPAGMPYVPPSPAALQSPGALGHTGAQRLTRRQLIAAAEAIFGVPATSAATHAPLDSASATYFESDYLGLSFSAQLIADYEGFATDYAAAVRADHTGFVMRAGCTPTGVTDSACFRAYASKVGRRVLRRAVTPAETQAWATALMPYAQADADFYSAVEGLVAAWLQHPAFLYRVEAVKPATGQLATLSGFEIATRIAFLITDLPPDETLLDAAAAGTLATEAGRRAQAERLLASPAATRAAEHFHTRWLGFDETFFPAGIEGDAMNETAELVERVTTDASSDWLELFTAKQTFVTPALAQHYGLPAPAAAGAWVDYPAGRGGGVLSHATVARLGAKFGDTSPTLRGYELMKRVMCGQLSGQIPAGIDIDTQPGSPTDCKDVRYYQRTVSACSSCHAVTDNIGFGLENLGAYGDWRTVEAQNPACSIGGAGEVKGQKFTGPAQLGELLKNDPAVAACATRQLFHVVVGRQSTADDQATLDALIGQYYQSRSWRSLLLAVVSSPAITQKGAN